MKPQDEAPLDAAELRRRAQAIAPPMVPDASSDGQPLSREQMMQQILYQLRVHQIELEMQNEHLRQAKAALEASQARYLDLYDLAPVGYLTVSESGLILQANHAAASLLGVARTDLPSQPITRFIFRDDQDLYYRLRRRSALSADAQSCELRLCKPDGRPFWVQLAASAAASEEAPSALRLVLSDMTERKQAEAKLQRAAQVFTHAREGIMITAANGTMLEVNEAFSRITGYRREEALGQNPRLLQSGRHDAAFYQAMWHELIERGHWAGEVWNRRKDGAVYAELLTISAVRDGQGQTVHYVGLFSDITERKAHQKQLEHLAHFDALTQLPNRVLLADRLQQALAQAARRGQTLALAYLDLDGFKDINDRHGHDAGDRLLATLASRMKQALREGDTLARIGGDEFVAVLIDLPDTAASVPTLARLLAAAAEPVQVDSLSLQVSASLGVSFYPQAQELDGDLLLRQADQAMYQAKQAGKNCYRIFDPVQDAHIRVHYESLTRVRQALSERQFVLYYQPKVNLRSGQVIGAEALIRWRHAERGLLEPKAFLPVIDDDSLAVAVGEWVIDTALTQIELWRAAGLDIAVSVNVGARQLQQLNFVDRLRALLAAHPKVPPGRLALEVLETSALADITRVSLLMQTCAQFGVMFALDDFGTGCSSVTCLQRLPVAWLKIDQSLVRDLLDNPGDQAILQGIVKLAEVFKCQVIAEGAETAAHATLLLQMGCELAQGFGIARPMPAADLPGWVARWQPNPAWAK